MPSASKAYQFFSEQKLQFHSPEKQPAKFKRFVGVELEVAGTKPDIDDPVVAKRIWKQNSGPECSCGCGQRTSGPVDVEEKDRFSNPEMIKLAEIVKKWYGSIVYDGSLPANSGFEIKTAPAIGGDFAKQIREICKQLEVLHAFVTEKCGTHIHVDMRDFDFADIRNLMYLYANYEGAWIQTQPSKRMLGRYCKPLGPDLIKGLDLVSHKSHVSEFRATVEGKYLYSERYKAMNFQAYREHKTVEIRMHEGTIDPAALTHWARCWSIFVQKAKDLTTEQILHLKPGLDSLVRLLDTKSADYLVERTQQYSDDWEAVKKAGKELKWVW